MRFSFVTLAALATVPSAMASALGKRATHSTKTIVSTVTTSTPVTINQAFDTSGVQTLIPGYLTVTIVNVPAYIYIETATPETTVTTIYSTVAVSTSTHLSSSTSVASITSSTIIKVASTTSKPPTSSATSKSTKGSTKTSSTTPAVSTVSSAPICEYTATQSGGPAASISGGSDAHDANSCAEACASTSGCLAFYTYYAQLSSGSGTQCQLLSSSISQLSAYLTDETAEGSGDTPIYFDLGCQAQSEAAGECGVWTAGPTTAGAKSLITNAWPLGDGPGPCYEGCQATAGCLSYAWSSQSSDAEGDISSVCAYYGKKIEAGIFSSTSGDLTAVYDRGCVPSMVD